MQPTESVRVGTMQNPVVCTLAVTCINNYIVRMKFMNKSQNLAISL